MNIKINYTAYLRGDWQLILKKHLFMLVKSGLYDACESFNVFAYPHNDDLEALLELYDARAKTRVVFSERNEFEFPAIRDLIKKPSDANLYFHTKGVTYRDNPIRYIPQLAWNDYMTYYNVLHWRTCVNLLEGCDAVGVEWVPDRDNPDRHFYGGNFWWTTKAHLERIRAESEVYRNFSTKAPSSSSRYLCEHIISSVHGAYMELCNGGWLSDGVNPLYGRVILGYRMDPEQFKTHRI